MKHPKDIVRDGYDKISWAYRPDAPDADTLSNYDDWLNELAPRLPAGSPVLDLGCGCGVPVAKFLAEKGFAVTGADISPVQISRARAAVPNADFLCADMTTLTFPAHAFAAVVSFYAVIHVPLAEQPARGVLTDEQIRLQTFHRLIFQQFFAPVRRFRAFG